MEYVKVEGHKNLWRDPETNALISIDNSGQESHNPEDLKKAYNVSLIMNGTKHESLNESTLIEDNYKLRQDLRNKFIELIFHNMVLPTT